MTGWRVDAARTGETDSVDSALSTVFGVVALLRPNQPFRTRRVEGGR